MRLKNIFKSKEPSEFYKRLMEDWGKDDVLGPWTKISDVKELKFYKSYWFITTDGSPNIEPITTSVKLKLERILKK